MSEHLKLYHFPQSGNARIVRLVLCEKGLEFDRANVDVVRGENRAPEFLKLNPRGKVPVLIHQTADGEVVLSESTIIAEYLEENFPNPPLMPSAPRDRARVRTLMHLFDAELSPAAGLLVIEKLLKPAEQQRADFIAERHRMVREILTRMIPLLGPEPYLFGAYSLADAVYTPLLTVLKPCGIDLETEYPRLARWLEAVKQRPSYVASEK